MSEKVEKSERVSEGIRTPCPPDVTDRNINDLQPPADKSGAESGALASQPAPVDPTLARLIARWPALPPAIRAGIAAMVDAVGPTA